MLFLEPKALEPKPCTITQIRLTSEHKGHLMNVENKVALVTGGASGLGRAAAVELANAGMRVALFDLSEEGLQDAVAEIGSERAMALAVDVTSADGVENAVAGVASAQGRIDVCVNCAGIATAKRLLNREGECMPLEDFSKTVTINLFGSFNVARVAAEYMAKNEADDDGGRGLIVNTASVAAFDGQVGQTAYSASKGGIVGMTLPMARDLAPVGIRVNAIAPGVMGTPMLLNMPEKVQEGLVANVQFPKRLGYPSEFGQLILHMAQNHYINGETVRLDGALRMPPK